MTDQTEMTTRWVVRRCPYCDEHGYLPNGFRCPHESPEAVAERAHRGAELARAQLKVSSLSFSRPVPDEPYLPPDLESETQARLEGDEQRQPEESA
jgi:hypothetical protein